MGWLDKYKDEGDNIPKFPKRVEDIKISPYDDRPQYEYQYYKSPEAIQADKNIYQNQRVHDILSDIGTGVLTWGTMLSPPTKEQLEKGRGDWSQIIPMVNTQAAIGLGFEVAPSVIGAAVKAPFQAYKGILNAANKGEIYKYNPFASKISETMGYKPLTESRASKILHGEPLLQYNNIAKTKSYLPVLDESGNVSHYAIRTNQDLFEKYSMNQPITVKINKATLTTNPTTGKISNPYINTESTLNEVLNKLNSGEFAGNSMQVGNSIIDLPTRQSIKLNPGKDYTKELTNKLLASKGGYSKISPDVNFTWGKAPSSNITIPAKDKFSPINKINRPLLLEADPTKISMVGAPTKGEYSSYIPKDIGNFPIGKTAIPEQSIIGQELQFPSKGLRMLKLDPVRGYIPISEAEQLRLFETGQFTPDKSSLIEGIQSIDKGLGVAKDFTKGTFNWMDEKINLARELKKSIKMSAEQEENTLHRKIWGIKDNIRKVTGYIEGRDAPYSNVDRYKNLTEGVRSQGEALVTNEKGLSTATNTGERVITDFRTGEKINAQVEIPKQYTKYEKVTGPTKKGWHIKNGEMKPIPIKETSLKQTEISSTDLKINDSYKKTLNNNISYIEEKIPGAKVFGSSKGVAEGGLPHLTHDYDVFISQKNYDKNVKGKLDYVGNMGPAQQHSIGKEFGQEGIVDFSIIEETASGKATGQRANELFKQFHPDEYFKASRDAYNNGTEIKIPYTPDELINNMDATVKTVIDSYESTKPKHINKIDSYISYGNPNIVKQAQEKYLKSLVGSKGTLGHQFPLEQFNNIEANKELLSEIDFIGDVNMVAKSPERMQVALNDYYINNTVLSRGVYSNTLVEAEQALKVWDPSYGGGQAMGSGMNHVLAGESGYGTMYGNKQLGLKLDVSSPANYVESIKHQVDGNYLFTVPEWKEVSEILDKYGIKSQGIIDTKDLINKTAYHEKAKDILSEVSQKTGKRAAAYSTYGNSTYASTLTDFDEAIDAIEFSIKKDVTVPKSYDTRRQNLKTSTSYVNNVQNFNKIKSLLDGGIKKAEERAKLYDSYVTKYEELIQDKTKKVVANSKGLQEQRKIVDKLRYEEAEAINKIDDLYKRKNRLETIRKGILGSIIGTGVIGAGVSAFDALDSKSEKDRYEFVTGTNFKEASPKTKETFKEWLDYTKKIQKENYKRYKESRKSGEKLDKETLQKALPWEEYRREKKLQSPNKLTNFTDYNSSSNWLDKYK